MTKISKITKMIAIRAVVATWEDVDKLYLSTVDGAVWIAVNDKLKAQNIMNDDTKWVAARQELSPP